MGFFDRFKKWESVHNKGAELARQGKYEEALEYFDEALELNPNDPELVWDNKGLTFERLGKYEEAVKCFDKSLKIDPKNAVALSRKGTVLGTMGKYNEALECFDKALELSPNSVIILNEKSFWLGILGRYEEALEYSNQALVADSKFTPAWTNRGFILEKLGKHSESQKSYEKALKLDPDASSILINKGFILGQLEKHDEAVEYYDRASQLDPCNIVAFENKGISLYNLGKYTEALECYDKYLELDPFGVDVLFKKGLVFEKLGKYDEAVACYNRAGAWYYMGICLNKLGRYEEALDCFKSVLFSDSDKAEPWHHKGIALKNLGKNEEALKCFNKALELNPECEEAKKFEESLKREISREINSNLTQQSDIVEAKEDLLGKNTVVSSSNENPDKLEEEIYKKLNNQKEKLKELKISRFTKFELKMIDKNLDLDPLHAGTWYDKGNVLKEIGEDEEALKCFDIALELKPEYKKAKKAVENLRFSGIKNQRFLKAKKDLLDKDKDPSDINTDFKPNELQEHKEPNKLSKFELKMLDKALDLDPLHAGTWYDKGIILKDIGENEEALKCFDMALALKPEYEKAKLAKEEVLKLMEKLED